MTSMFQQGFIGTLPSNRLLILIAGISGVTNLRLVVCTNMFSSGFGTQLCGCLRSANNVVGKLIVKSCSKTLKYPELGFFFMIV